MNLDFSPKSLGELDLYFEKSGEKGNEESIDFVKKLGAYLTQVVTKKTGGVWSFPEDEDIPSIRIGGVFLTPLARVLKVLNEGEKLGQWYRVVTDTIPRLQARRPD
ncbi:hypothetical protein E6H36_04525 [Candidatus Bathyarchaeota archaeon]|nr:MAG: hypothetical protein E6H36_04525 [Candidatus Bathyarchaeota archaeon]TMI32274.1 MAG: hypothetical protein E6H29_02525 [Candidatus Bathyarchaeota archaeon]